MRDDENASTPKKKASRAFYPELPDEVAWFDSLFSLGLALFNQLLPYISRRISIAFGYERRMVGSRTSLYSAVNG